MATLTLNYFNLNSAIQVGDHVFYTSLATSGAYKVNDSISETYGDSYIGDVKSISQPVPDFDVTLSSTALPFNTYWQGVVEGGALGTIKISNVNSTVHYNPVDFDDITQEWIDMVGATSGSWYAYSSTDGNDAPQTGVMDEWATSSGIQGLQLAFDVDFSGASSASNWFFSLTSFANNGSKKILMSDTSNIEVGDRLYIKSSTGAVLLESVVSAVSSNTHVIINDEIFIVNAQASHVTIGKHISVEVNIKDDDMVLPFVTDYFYFVKDNNVNDSGVLGYYSQVKIENDSTTKAELFSVSTEVFESSK